MKLFWNSEERRLRAGWRIFVQVCALVAVQIGQGLVGFLLGKGPLSMFASGVVYLVLGLASVMVLAIAIDRRDPRDYGLRLSRGWWVDFGFGFFLGALLMSLIVGGEVAAGWLTIRPAFSPAAWTSFFAAFVMFIAVAFYEEFTFRGFQIKNLAEGWCGRRCKPAAVVVAAWIFSSALFGLIHAANPNASLASTLNIFISAGGLLGLAYILTGQMSIAIGFHLSWNLIQGPFYGLPVSGSTFGTSLFRVAQTGPVLWTGGKFGPEAGLVTTVVAIVGFALILGWVKLRRGMVWIDTEVATYRPFRLGEPPPVQPQADPTEVSE